jgi:hypothetical protein
MSDKPKRSGLRQIAIRAIGLLVLAYLLSIGPAARFAPSHALPIYNPLVRACDVCPPMLAIKDSYTGLWGAWRRKHGSSGATEACHCLLPHPQAPGGIPNGSAVRESGNSGAEESQRGQVPSPFGLLQFMSYKFIQIWPRQARAPALAVPSSNSKFAARNSRTPSTALLWACLQPS